MRTIARETRSSSEARSRKPLAITQVQCAPMEMADGVGAGSAGEGDVRSKLAFTRAIAHQRRGRAEANQIGARQHQFGCALAYALCHRLAVSELHARRPAGSRYRHRLDHAAGDS